MPDRPGKPKKRGAPYGNTNARIHGYYSSRLRYLSFNRARRFDPAAVGDQLPLLVAYIDQVKEYVEHLEDVADGGRIIQALDSSIALLIQAMQSRKLDTGQLDANEWARRLLDKFLLDLNAGSPANA